MKDGFIDVIIFQNPELEAYKSLKILCDYIWKVLNLNPGASSLMCQLLPVNVYRVIY